MNDYMRIARLEVKIMSICGEIENIQKEIKELNKRLEELQKVNNNNADKLCVSCGGPASKDFCEFCLNEE